MLVDIRAMRQMTRDKVEKARELSDKGKVVCPAGTAHGTNGIECSIEEQLIDPNLDPSTVVNFCCSEYSVCPTWRLSKKEDGSTASSFVSAARRAKAKAEDRENAFLEEFNERFGV